MERPWEFMEIAMGENTDFNEGGKGVHGKSYGVLGDCNGREDLKWDLEYMEGIRELNTYMEGAKVTWTSICTSWRLQGRRSKEDCKV